MGDNGPITDLYVDPHAAPWQDELFRCCLTRTLLSYSGRTTADGGTVLRPDLAEALPELSADGLTWTFRVKEGLRYAPPYDDTEITSHDLVRGIERGARLSDGPPYFGSITGVVAFQDGTADSIAGLETPDDHTLVIRTEQPDADIATAVSVGLSSPLPAGAADGHDADYGHFLISSGPYMYEGSPQLTKGVGGQSLSGRSGVDAATLVRNPSWDRSTDALRGAWVDRIEFSRPASFDDDRARFASGTIDLPGYPIRAVELSSVRADAAQGARIAFATFPRLTFLPMNMALPPFDDVAVRRAVNLAVDRAAIVAARSATDLGTTLRVARHAIPDSFEDNLLLDYDPFPSAGDGGDIDAARRAMSASRYDGDRDGRCDANACSAVPYTIGTDSTTDAELAIVIENLAGIGIVLVPRTGDAPPLDVRSHNGTHVLSGWGADSLALGGYDSLFLPPVYGPGLDTYFSFSGTLMGSTSDQLAEWGYGTTQVDSLEGKRAECDSVTGSERFNCAAEMDQLVMERAVAIVPIAFPEVGFMYGPRVGTYAIDQAFTAPALDQIALQP